VTFASKYLIGSSI